ncbi:MAG: HAD family hydrolase [Planctomycetia bacterium]|jgi:predicted HAD superfamily hydrolase
MYLLRTVDVWDTLLRRDCHPECIKKIVAQHVCLRYAADIAEEYRDEEAAYAARLSVESMLARRAVAAGKDDEYSIGEVVETWLGQIAPSVNASLAVPEVIDYEFVVEAAHSVPDPDIRETLEKHPAAKTIFLSDFYWPSDLLLKLIHSKNLHTLVSEGVTSCDIGRNKRSGGLYRYILESYNVQAHEVLHIGDNRVSDVVAAQKLGIAAVHFVPTARHQERLQNEKRFSRPALVYEQAAKESLANVKNVAEELEASACEAFCAGVDAASLFIGFALYVAESAIRNRLDRIYFLTREGVFLHRVFEAMFPLGSWIGLPLPATAILDVSRASTQAAALQQPTEQVLDRRRWPYRGHTVGVLCAAIGLDPKECTSALSRVGLQAEDVIAHPSEDERVRQLLKDEEIICAAKAATSIRHREAVAYLREKGLEDSGRYGIVDVGWRGTIQDHVAAMLPRTEFQGFYLALKDQLTSPLGNVRKAACFFVEGDDWKTGRLLETYGLIEMLCGSSVGSVTGYALSAEGTVPIRDLRNDECPYFAAVVQPFQDGVISACHVWRRHVDQNGFGSRALHACGMSAWRRLSQTSSGAIVEAFLATRMHDPFALPPYLLPSSMPDWRLLMRAAYAREARRAVWDYVRRVQWRHAMRRTQHRGSPSSVVLSGLCTAATIYRQLQWYRRRATRWGEGAVGRGAVR